mmetsp:Transcript_62563/g.179459  ORF Transcript_62563/g.179459 Transcript_62563/m.179459 type:complete len:80 (-) Transcript_62563:175-414(-)
MTNSWCSPCTSGSTSGSGPAIAGLITAPEHKAAKVGTDFASVARKAATADIVEVCPPATIIVDSPADVQGETGTERAEF